MPSLKSSACVRAPGSARLMNRAAEAVRRRASMPACRIDESARWRAPRIASPGHGERSESTATRPPRDCAPMAMSAWSATSFVVTCCKKSRRIAAMRPWQRLSLATAFLRLAEPFLLRETACCSRFMRRWSRPTAAFAAGARTVPPHRPAGCARPSSARWSRPTIWRGRAMHGGADCLHATPCGGPGPSPDG